MDELVIAIDPGREKCGVAVVHKEKGVLIKYIIDTAALAATVQQLADRYAGPAVVLGDRTSSSQACQTIQQLRHNGASLTVILVDEHRSTDAARQRYWQDNPPRGLRRLIPVTMQVPPVPVDDYVAVILAERYFVGQ